MDIRPIRTKADHRAALQAVETLMGAKARTPEGDRLDVLVTLIESYERQHYPMDLPDAVEAIKFRMEQQRLTPSCTRGSAFPPRACCVKGQRQPRRTDVAPRAGL